MFPYNLRMKMNDGIANGNIVTSSSQNYSTNTNSTLSRTRSSSRNSFHNQSNGSQKGGGGKIEFRQNMDNILAWKTIDDNTLETVEEDKKMSSTRETNTNTVESSTVASTYIRQDNSSSIPSSKLIQSIDESDSSGDSSFSDDGRKDIYEGKMNDTANKRSTMSNRYRSNQISNNGVINPEKFFANIAKKTKRPVFPGRVRDRRNNARRQRPHSAGPSRRRNYGNMNGNTYRNNNGGSNEFQFQRQQQRRRPQSAGVGNRRRRGIVDIPASTRMIVVKQYGVS